MTSAEPDEELLDPFPEDLIESLRAFGYDLPTALADLVDNSIAAGARTVRVAYSSDRDSAWVAVMDDGRGMSEEALRAAMRFARNPNAERAAGDLGRFGLGLKTASLSQARKLTVLSKDASGNLSVRSWDIDHVIMRRQWLVITQLDDQARKIADQLEFTDQGTLVLWRNTDKLGHGPSLSRRINEAGRELSLLFHRFIERGRLELHVGGHQLTAMDPYLRKHPATQDRGVETLEHKGHTVRLNPVVLPHPSRLTRQDAALASGPGGMLARQGFYVYRGDRLVVAGGWLGLSGMHNSQPTRLARLSVEIPPGADLSWEVDVRKSTVRPPSVLEARIVEIAKDLRARSERVFTHRGTPTPGTRDRRELQVVWQQVRRLGTSEYTVNRSHPLVAAVISGPGGDAIDGLLRMIETAIPVNLIAQEIATSADAADNTAESAPDVEEILALFRSMLTGLPEAPEGRRALMQALAKAEPFSRYPGLVQEIIESETSKEN
ncbi:ATP-binding protein [Planotetraspora phitsanulokensis]|uniref:ATPase n=1 Tax=Planotetraspora phitsanulokensis TaxID=575192 RepID=A0A8J3UDI7_9ACTN|nr:ATP-binding protein [Planotetraspora phitsanulokensis]GII37050.1 ATPase [Planotetraspora phitsanulokensis]